MNDLVKYVKNTKLALYANDTAFFLGSNDINYLYTELITAANKFKYWCDLNKLTLNLNKSKILLLSGHTMKKIRLIKKQVKVTIDNIALDLVCNYRYLGLIIDECLRFEDHVRMIKKKILCKLYLLRKIRWSINYIDALRLYKSSILPFYEIGSIFYNCCDKNNLAGLQNLQNKSHKVIIGKRNWNGIDQAHIKCGLLKTESRRIINLLIHGHQPYNPLPLESHEMRSLRPNRKLMK